MRSVSGPSSALATLVAVSCLFCARLRAEEPWTVWVAGEESSDRARPRLAGDALVVDSCGIADLLNMAVQHDGPAVQIRTADGTTWTATQGAYELRSPARVVALRGPMLVVGEAVFLDVEAIARVSGFAVWRNPDQQRIEFVPPVDAATRLVGSRRFSIAKAPEEMEAARRLEAENVGQAGASDVPPVLPARRDRFKLGTGAGYMPGGDGALEFGGSGRINGFDTNLQAFLTLGRRGPEWYDGRIAFEDPVKGQRLVAGDLVNEVRGLSRGASVSWQAAGGRQPAVSWYRPRFPRSGSRDVFTYRDHLPVGSRVMLEGEAGTDGAFLGKTMWTTRQVGVNTYYHHGTRARDVGGDVSVNIWREVGVGGALRASRGDDAAGERFGQAFIRVPVAPGVAVRLERNHYESLRTRTAMNAVTINVPAGPVQIMTRWQDRNVEVASAFARTWYGHAQRGLQTTAAYAPARRLRLNLNVATEWLENGRTEQFQEASAQLEVSRGTSLNATVRLPDVQSVERLRMRLTHRMTSKLSVVAELGRFSAFQAPVVAGDQFPSRFKVFIRRDWNVDTPARGGSVAGRVVDQIGITISDAVIHLGSYRTVTDKSGRYHFDRVPPGSYRLRLDAEHLPAAYSTNSADREISVRRGRTVFEDFVVAPLNAVNGRVYVDRNGNRHADEGEGVGGVLLRLGARVTTSADDGSYAFYNLEPGVYAVQVVLERVPAGYVLTNEPLQLVELNPGSSAQVTEFRFAEKQKAIIFRELRR